MCGLENGAGQALSSAEHAFHQNAEAISAIAGTISAGCAVATVAVIDAPLTGTCALVFGGIALAADGDLYAHGEKQWYDVALDAASVIPGVGEFGAGWRAGSNAAKFGRALNCGKNAQAFKSAMKNWRQAGQVLKALDTAQNGATVPKQVMDDLDVLGAPH